MKLLPLACFAASAAQSGDYDYGAVDDDRHYGYNSYGNYDDYGNKNSYSFGGGSRAAGSNQQIAVALNCWPANFDTDTLMGADTGELTPKENHPFGPIHLYGTENRHSLKSGTAGFASNDPGLRSGMGGHYAYGHHTTGATHSSAPSHWVHYHSARHAGCLYEVADFSYNAVSWNRVFHMWYFNGYYNRATKSEQTAANLDGVEYAPNWVHFFNAHVLPHSASGSMGSVNPDGGQTDGNSIQLVMANPQYEGLGWLNFVATYQNSASHVGDSYKEFADSTHVTTTGDLANRDTYTAINSLGVQQTQGTTGNYYYDAWMGTWEMNMDTALTWESTYSEASGDISFSAKKLSFSSFPHNELGKDFRFNLRVLLADTDNTSRKMYYFYKINSIVINFPAPVAYALYYDGRDDTPGSNTMSGGGASGTFQMQGEGLYNVGQNDSRDNIIPPLDLGSHAEGFNEGADPRHLITGYLSNTAAHSCDATDDGCAAFCKEISNTGCAAGDLSCEETELEQLCSTQFLITGLMNTYSQRLGGQRGTYQEIWVQLSYAMEHTTANTNAAVEGSLDKVTSPFPYLHFMAYNVAAPGFTCDVVNVINGNDCQKFAAFEEHDMGFGG
jgi:hypothetical protein